MALVVLSVVEQRLDAVRAVLDGAEVTEVAARMGVHRATLHRWVVRYLSRQLAGLADRSHRPHSSPHQAAEVVEAAVVEMRREHPRWGSRRIRLEMLRKPAPLFSARTASCRSRGISAGQAYRTSSPVTALPMIIRWISDVPSKIVKIFASRCQRSTGYSRV